MLKNPEKDYQLVVDYEQQWTVFTEKIKTNVFHLKEMTWNLTNAETNAEASLHVVWMICSIEKGKIGKIKTPCWKCSDGPRLK